MKVCKLLPPPARCSADSSTHAANVQKVHAEKFSGLLLQLLFGPLQRSGEGSARVGGPERQRKAPLQFGQCHFTNSAQDFAPHTHARAATPLLHPLTAPPPFLSQRITDVSSFAPGPSHQAWFEPGAACLPACLFSKKNSIV